MKLTLRRTHQAGNATLGDLQIDGEHECYTLEDVVRDPGVKIPGETAIPAGTYRVMLTWSPRFKRTLPLIADVPGFSGIRIHPGNTTDDTEGCILVGQEIQDDHLVRSRAAFARLMEQLQEAERAGEEVTIEIVDAIEDV